MRAQRDGSSTDAQIEILEAELAQLRRQRERNTLRSQNEQTRARLVRHIENTLDEVPESPVQDDMYSAPLEDAAAPQEPALSQSVLLPRPTRESNLRFELAAASSSQPLSPQRQTSFMPSPPHSLSDTTRSRPVDGPLDTWGTTLPLTQGFAPARAALSAFQQSDGLREANTELPRSVEDDRPGLETPPPESWESSYPPLRRVPHMSPRPLPRSTLDGLGDRHRSPSSLSENQEEATWNHLLTTMDHGRDVSSTSTSFASMTDLLSTSRTSSHESSNTQNTSTSFGEIGASTEDMCDLPPGITDDDVRQIRDRHRRTARRVTAPRRDVAESEYDDRSLLNVGDENTEAVISRSSSRSDSSLSILLREARQSRERRQRRRDELTMLQAIAERQQSQEHVPDDWWALAGLPPSLARTQDE